MDASGAAVLVVAPRAAIGDLLPDLARFKPQLIELLSVSICQSSGGHSEAQPDQIAARASSLGMDSQTNASGPSRPNLGLDDATARRRVMPELRRMLPDDDILQIGRALLMLDAGEAIE